MASCRRQSRRTRLSDSMAASFSPATQRLEQRVSERAAPSSPVVARSSSSLVQSFYLESNSPAPALGTLISARPCFKPRLAATTSSEKTRRSTSGLWRENTKQVLVWEHWSEYRSTFKENVSRIS